MSRARRGAAPRPAPAPHGPGSGPGPRLAGGGIRMARLSANRDAGPGQPLAGPRRPPVSTRARSPGRWPSRGPAGEREVGPARPERAGGAGLRRAGATRGAGQAGRREPARDPSHPAAAPPSRGTGAAVIRWRHAHCHARRRAPPPGRRRTRRSAREGGRPRDDSDGSGAGVRPRGPSAPPNRAAGDARRSGGAISGARAAFGHRPAAAPIYENPCFGMIHDWYIRLILEPGTSMWNSKILILGMKCQKWYEVV